MTLNFSLRKAWSDLTSNKKNLFGLLLMALLFIMFDFLDLVFKTKTSASYCGVLFSGYLALMANNIIINAEPVLGDILSSTKKGKNIFTAGFKTYGINLIYSLLLLLIGWGFFSLLYKSVIKTLILAILAAILLILPFYIFVSVFGSLLFAENLRFRDGFKLKRAMISFKLAWKEYLVSWGLYLILIIAILAIVAAIVCILNIIASANPIDIMGHPSKMFVMTSLGSKGGNFSGTILGTIGAVIAGYFSTHLSAQAYKYSLTRMNITEN